MFASPGDIIMTQGDFGKAMYFIQRGDCIVNIKDRNGNEKEVHKLLVESDHFGEIAMIYNCRRTATVIGRNYNTMARLNNQHFKKISTGWPRFKTLFEKRVLKYQDTNLNWLKKVIKQIDYFNMPIKISRQSLYKMIYLLEKENFESGELILKEK